MPKGIEARLRKGLPTRTLTPRNMVFPYKIAFNVVIFVERGHVESRINMKDYTLESNSILLTSSGIVLDSLEYQAGTRFLIIAYNDSSLFASMNSRSAKIIRASIYSPLYLPIRKDRMERYRQLLRVILHVAEGGPDYSFRKDIVNGFAEVISGGIARIILEKNSSAGSEGRGYELLREFIALVQENCREERSLEFYSRKMCISSKYLSRVVSETSGKKAYVYSHNGATE